jgi:hypothetical protein
VPPPGVVSEEARVADGPYDYIIVGGSSAGCSINGMIYLRGQRQKAPLKFQPACHELSGLGTYERAPVEHRH